MNIARGCTLAVLMALLFILHLLGWKMGMDAEMALSLALVDVLAMAWLIALYRGALDETPRKW